MRMRASARTPPPRMPGQGLVGVYPARRTSRRPVDFARSPPSSTTSSTCARAASRHWPTAWCATSASRSPRSWPTTARRPRMAPQPCVVDYEPLEPALGRRSGPLPRARRCCTRTWATTSRRVLGAPSATPRRRSRRPIGSSRGRLLRPALHGHAARDARRGGPVGRRARVADAVVVDPVAAHLARVAVGRARAGRSTDSGDRAGRRRRVRGQAGHLPRGGRARRSWRGGRATGEVGRDAAASTWAPRSTRASSGTTMHLAVARRWHDPGHARRGARPTRAPTRAAWASCARR